MVKRWIVTHLFYRYTDVILYKILTDPDIKVIHRTDVMMNIEGTEEAVRKAFSSGWKVVEAALPEKPKPKPLVISGSDCIAIGKQHLFNINGTNYNIALGYNAT